MTIRLTAAQAKQYGIRAKAAPQPKPRRPDGFASQLEADYAQELNRAYLHQDIQQWFYQPWQFILVPGPKPVRYTPDFLVIPRKGRWEIHETKGYWRRDERIKMKLCAEKWGQDFRIFGVMKVNGLWDFEEFS